MHRIAFVGVIALGLASGAQAQHRGERSAGESDELGALRAQIEAVRAEIGTRIVDLEARTNARIDGQQRATSAEVAALKAHLDATRAELQKQVQAQQAQLDALKANLSARIADLEARTNARIDGQQRATSAEIAATKAQLDATKAELQKQVQAQQAQLQAVRSELQSARTELANATAKVQAEATVLRQDVTRLTSNDETIVAGLGQWQQALEAWRGQHFLSAIVTRAGSGVVSRTAGTGGVRP